ncbi:ATP-binding protein [Streptomyces sp. TRM 70361]|uniref:ATP-binding protein n=1 Tax=Streptomyces sp. TRM 70361 TaxID=3116553 RepID=UPI002E7BAEE3|nr:ATP-binding protein [Streptomyces sp. TRM 70361]MEE1941648.1 ATP-binding protein [Streptomyces sp. TRM 70361]
MDAYGIREPRLRSVLPFRAVPEELGRLRSAVREQLGLWGLTDLLSQAELVTGELAANVYRHVGEGATASLVLMMGDGRLRLEVHDECYAVPTLRHPTDYDESGRGLRLLAAVTAAWGTLLTASGKAVWCEFPLGTGEECLRLRRAVTALEVYGRLSGQLMPTGTRNLAALEGSVTGLIADLRHWLTAQGRDPDCVLGQIQSGHGAGSGAS